MHGSGGNQAHGAEKDQGHCTAQQESERASPGFPGEGLLQDLAQPNDGHDSQAQHEPGVQIGPENKQNQ